MYLALARKYRPQRFQDLIGQPHVTKTLQNAIEMDKLYPALIFSGMKGVGKTSAARILAKALNCEQGPAVEPCNRCAFCVEITEDRSPDYIEIDGASNNGVEEVRNLKEKVRYKPLKNKFRVVVIDEVHMLSHSAWNALLKTIEEPPGFTYFIMATTDFHKIPATIVSRCQHFEFKRIPYEVIITVLKEICTKEGIKVPDYSLYLISRAADGSLRDAKKILDQAIAISSGNVQDKDVIAILGVIEEEIFIKITRAFFSKDQKEIIEIINSLSERGMDLRFFYNEYLKFFRDIIVLKSLEESEKLHNLNPENVPEIKEILKNTREVELLRYFNALKDMEQTVKNTENPRIILEYLFLKLSYFPSLISIEELLKNMRSSSTAVARLERQEPAYNMEQLPEEGGDKNRQEGEGESQAVKEKGEPGVGEFSALLMEKLAGDKPRLASALASSSLLLRDDVLEIEFSQDAEHFCHTVQEGSEYLKGLAADILKRGIDVQVKVKQGTKKGEVEVETEELKGDERINSLMDTLKGKIISVQKMKGE